MKNCEVRRISSANIDCLFTSSFYHVEKMKTIAFLFILNAAIAISGFFNGTITIFQWLNGFVCGVLLIALIEKVSGTYDFGRKK